MTTLDLYVAAALVATRDAAVQEALDLASALAAAACARFGHDWSTAGCDRCGKKKGGEEYPYYG